MHLPVIDVLAWELVANTKGLVAGLGAGTSKLKKFAALAGSTVGVAAALGAALAIIGVKAAKMAAELDEALRQVATLLPQTSDQLGDVRKAIIALSTRVPQPPVQLTAALYQAISAGARDTAEALFLVEVAAKAAVAGQSDTETAVSAISTVLNAYQLDISEANRVSDVFFKTIERGVLRFSDIAANIGDVATTASLAGVSIEELGAAFATMTKFGISAAESTTALNRFLLSVVVATDDQKKAAKDLGVEFTITALKTKGLVRFLREMEEAVDGDIEKLAAINPNIRAARAAFILAGEGGDTFREILDEMADSTGSADAAFQEMLGSAQNLSTLIKNKLNATLFELGEPILKDLVIPALQLMNEILPELGTSTDTWSEQIRKLNENLTQLERIGLVIRGLFTDDFITALNTLTTGGTLREAFPQIARGFSPREVSEGVQEIDFLDIQKRSLAEQKAALEQLRELLVLKISETTDEALRLTLFRQIDRVTKFLDEVNVSISKIKPTGKKAADAVDTLAESLEELEKAWDRQIAANERAAAANAAFADFTTDAQIRSFVKELEIELKVVETIGEKALVVSGLLKKWNVSIDDLTPEMRQLVTFYEELDLSSENTALNAAKLADNIGTAARSMVELGEALGLLPDGLGQVASQLDLIAQGTIGIIEGIQKGASLGALAGPIGSAVGGLAGLISGIFGGGPSEQEAARLASLEANTDRLRRLNNSIDDLRNAMFDLPGQLSQDLVDALEFGRAGRGPGDLPGGIGRGDEIFQRFLDVLNALKGAGITPEEIERIADTLGIEVDRLIEALTKPFRGGEADFLEFLEQAESLLAALGIQVADFFDTIAGRLEIANRRIALFDIEDPIDQIAEFVKVIQESGVGLSAADIKRLRAGDETLIQELVNQIETGTGRFADRAALGEFTARDLIDLLANIESIADRLPGGEGLTTSFQTFDQITRIEGNAIIAALGTSNFFLREVAQNTAALVSIFGSNNVQPVTVPNISPTSEPSGGGVVESNRVFSSDAALGVELEALRLGNGLPRVEF